MAAGFTVRTYSTGTDLLADLKSNMPECIVLDVRMPGQSGFDIQEALAKRGISLPIVFLTGYADIPETVRAIRAGAVDFLTKPIDQRVLVDAVTRALAKGASDRVVLARRQALMAQYERLTPREREVLGHLIKGEINRQVAAHLNITERTVKVHRAQLLQKLQVDSIAALVRFAIEIGLEPPAPVRK
jgi:FixJ family two-component response regulator